MARVDVAVEEEDWPCVLVRLGPQLESIAKSNEEDVVAISEVLVEVHLFAYGDELSAEELVVGAVVDVGDHEVGVVDDFVVVE